MYLREKPLIGCAKLLMGLFGLCPPSKAKHFVADLQPLHTRSNLDDSTRGAIAQHVRMLDKKSSVVLVQVQWC